MPSRQTSYRDSHKAPAKGRTYDEYYATNRGAAVMWSVERAILAELLESHFGNREVNLLDFACGTGRLTQFLEEIAHTSTGVDVSPSMLREARQKLKRTRLIEADLASNNVLEGEKFNLITAFRFFVNAEPPLRKRVMRTLVGLLAEDGYLVFNNHHNRSMPWWVWTHIRNRGQPAKQVFNVMTLQEMRRLASDAGLRIAEVRHMGLLAPPLAKMLPESWSVAIEQQARRHKALASISSNLIVACRHNRHTDTAHSDCICGAGVS